MIDAFLEAFEPRRTAAPQVPFRWAALYLMLDNWSESGARGDSSLRYRYLDACFDAVVRRRIAELETAAVTLAA
jgi:hypothetical protein